MIPLADIFIALKWLLVLYACSIIGVLIFAKKDDKYPILRYSVGKSFGVILVAAIAWILSLLRIVPFSFWFLLLIVTLLLLALIFIKWHEIAEIIRANWRAYVFIEVVFLVIFAAGIFLRATHPKIEGIEKFMDSAILSNLLRHQKGVPVDTWYAPDTINYYYFGHWMLATIAKLSHTAVNYAFNLGSATVLALSGSMIFGLAWQLAKKRWAGFLAIFLALFASNIHPLLSAISGTSNYFFFSSGRFIEQVINEYPYYSFVLGELHAQMIALIISTAFYGVVALMILEKEGGKGRLAMAGLAGAMVGLLVATNTFDVVSGYVVFILAIGFLKFYKGAGAREVLRLFATFMAISVFVGLFFLVSFKPGVGGVGISLFKTPLWHIFMQFGLPVLIAGGSFLILKKKDLKKDKVAIPVIFGLAGLALVFIPQFVFLKDIYHFENPPFERANTVFKTWYSAWPLIAVSAAVLAVYALNAIKKSWQFLASVLVIVFCFLLLFGTYKGIGTLTDEYPNTLDGFDYLKTFEPYKLDTLNWANKNIKGQPVVAQASGESYTELSWFSSYTGTASPLGWASHEWGWRYDNTTWPAISARMGKVKNLYESLSGELLKRQANELGLDYILLGPDELGAYNVSKDIFTSTFGAPVYQNSNYAIYKIN